MHNIAEYLNILATLLKYLSYFKSRTITKTSKHTIHKYSVNLLIVSTTLNEIPYKRPLVKRGFAEFRPEFRIALLAHVSCYNIKDLLVRM